MELTKNKEVLVKKNNNNGKLLKIKNKAENKFDKTKKKHA